MLLMYPEILLTQAGVIESGPPPADGSLYFEILTVLDLTILPTLSSLPHNCCVADEIWDVLKLYPYNFRLVDLLFKSVVLQSMLCEADLFILF